MRFTYVLVNPGTEPRFVFIAVEISLRPCSSYSLQFPLLSTQAGTSRSTSFLFCGWWYSTVWACCGFFHCALLPRASAASLLRTYGLHSGSSLSILGNLRNWCILYIFCSCGVMLGCVYTLTVQTIEFWQLFVVGRKTDGKGCED